MILKTEDSENLATEAEPTPSPHRIESQPDRPACGSPEKPTRPRKRSAAIQKPASDATLPISASDQAHQIGDRQSEIGDHKEHRHTGKVGRLPKEVRDQINQMILDGVTYKKIISQLGPPGVGLTENNISNWKTDGGFDDYLEEQERLYEYRARFEFLERVAKTDLGTSNYQASPKMALGLISEVLADLGPQTLRKGLQEDPRNAVRLLNTLARILGGGLRCEQHLLDVSERQASAVKQTCTAHKGLSKGAKDEILEELNLL
jgi:hypothetical protein